MELALECVHEQVMKDFRNVDNVFDLTLRIDYYIIKKTVEQLDATGADVW